MVTYLQHLQNNYTYDSRSNSEVGFKGGSGHYLTAERETFIHSLECLAKLSTWLFPPPETDSGLEFT